MKLYCCMRVLYEASRQQLAAACAAVPRGLSKTIGEKKGGHLFLPRTYSLFFPKCLQPTGKKKKSFGSDRPTDQRTEDGRPVTRYHRIRFISYFLFPSLLVWCCCWLLIFRPGNGRSMGIRKSFSTAVYALSNDDEGKLHPYTKFFNIFSNINIRNQSTEKSISNWWRVKQKKGDFVYCFLFFFWIAMICQLKTFNF